MAVKSLSVPSGMLSLCCTLIRRDISVSHNDSSSPHLLCTVTDKRLLNIAVSIYCLPVCSPLPPPIFHRAFLTNSKKKKKEKSPHSLWIGQEVERGLLLSALPLACAWHLGFFVLPSTSRQKKKKTPQPKQIKPSLSQSACLSHGCSISASPRSKRKKKNHRVVCVRD